MKLQKQKPFIRPDPEASSLVTLIAPPGVTSVGGYDLRDGRVSVPPDIAAQLLGPAHGFKLANPGPKALVHDPISGRVL